MLAELKKLENNFGTYKDVEARIDEREKCHLRLGFKESMGMTKGQIDDRRKKEVIENLTGKYGQVTVGIHGQELPKFNADSSTQNWWKHTKTYNPLPAFTSALEMKETKKFWAKNDEMKLADVKEHVGPQDPFRQTYVKKVIKDDVPPKISTISHWNDQSGESRPPEF